MDRSLSVSFDEEVKQGQHKFQEKKDTQSMEVENCIEEEKEGNQEKEENDSVSILVSLVLLQLINFLFPFIGL